MTSTGSNRMDPDLVGNAETRQMPAPLIGRRAASVGALLAVIFASFLPAGAAARMRTLPDFGEVMGPVVNCEPQGFPDAYASAFDALGTGDRRRRALQALRT